MHARILLEADENQHEEKTDEEIAQLLYASKKKQYNVFESNVLNMALRRHWNVNHIL